MPVTQAFISSPDWTFHHRATESRIPPHTWGQCHQPAFGVDGIFCFPCLHMAAFIFRLLWVKIRRPLRAFCIRPSGAALWNCHFSLGPGEPSACQLNSRCGSDLNPAGLESLSEDSKLKVGYFEMTCLRPKITGVGTPSRGESQISLCQAHWSACGIFNFLPWSVSIVSYSIKMSFIFLPVPACCPHHLLCHFTCRFYSYISSYALGLQILPTPSHPINRTGCGCQLLRVYNGFPLPLPQLQGSAWISDC